MVHQDKVLALVGSIFRFYNAKQFKTFKRFKSFFRVFVETFYYICGIVGVHIERNPPPSLKPIVGRWMTIPKQVAMTLRRLATGDSHYSEGQMFGVAAYTSVKTSKRFIKKKIIVAIPLHLKWPAGEKLVIVKFGFQNIYDILQYCSAIDCTHILFDKPLDTNNVDWFDSDHNYNTIL